MEVVSNLFEEIWGIETSVIISKIEKVGEKKKAYF
jgi:hypothetical protein